MWPLFCLKFFERSPSPRACPVLQVTEKVIDRLTVTLQRSERIGSTSEMGGKKQKWCLLALFTSELSASFMQMLPMRMRGAVRNSSNRQGGNPSFSQRF